MRYFSHSSLPPSRIYDTPDNFFYQYGSSYEYITTIKMPYHFGVMVVVKAVADGSLLYHPVQSKHMCYRDIGFNVQCRIISVKHTSKSIAPDGYGGKSGIGSPTCKSGLVANGIDCTSPNFLGPSVKFQAFETCSESGDVLLVPHNLIQNHMIKAMMIQHVRHDSSYRNSKQDYLDLLFLSSEPFEIQRIALLASFLKGNFDIWSYVVLTV